MKVETPAEQLLFSTVRIEAKLDKGKRSTGTGFLFQIGFQDKNYPMLVTNKHVVEGAVSTTFLLLSSCNGVPDYQDRISCVSENPNKDWFGHPDPEVDIAVAAFDPILNMSMDHKRTPFYRTILDSFIPTSEQLEDLDVLEPILFIGYPNNIYDEVHLLPILRRGITATPLSIDYNGKPAFLIDASVFPGSSGSPVFICDSGAYLTRDGVIMGGNRTFFLGILSSVYFKTEVGEVKPIEIPTQYGLVAIVRQMIDLGVVIKSRMIEETCRLCLKEKYGVDCDVDS